MTKIFCLKTTVNKISCPKNVSGYSSSCAAYTAAPALHKMSDCDATTTISNLVDAGDDDVQIVNSMFHQSENSTLAIATFNTSK